MANIIWNEFSEQEQKEYIEFLKIFGSLSGLFKDISEGSNAKKPYLYYRNHEQLFARVFNVEDLTRKDSSFDALAIFGEKRIGIGLKTWIHSRDKTFQKVAEFNKLAPEEITPLIKSGNHVAVIKKIAELRNTRILLDQRLHNTQKNVYHYITRDDNIMNIIESSYDLIDIEKLKLISTDGKTYNFEDGSNEYKYYTSKSVLLKNFPADSNEVIEKIDIKQFDDPFELLKMIQLPEGSQNKIKQPLYSKLESGTTLAAEHKKIYKKSKQQDTPKALENKKIYYEEIYLPLYSERGGIHVPERSGLNIRHACSKNKGTNTPRPMYELETRISKWIHHVFPNFFGFDALNNENVKDNSFELHLPNGNVLNGRIKQENGKSLQTDPQSALGEWVIKDVLGFKNREVVTMKYLYELGIDSLKITKLNDKQFKITVAEIGAYEKFKLENKKRMEELGLSGKSLPKFFPELINNEEGI